MDDEKSITEWQREQAVVLQQILEVLQDVAASLRSIERVQQGLAPE